jgi:Putative methyltransferase
MVWSRSPPVLGVAHLLLALSDHEVLRSRSASCLSRAEAANVLNQNILPSTEKGARIQLGGQRLHRGVAVAGNDPVLYETYGEFPLGSLDILLDRAEELVVACGESSTTKTVVDLGSGCGRLALYMALSRPSWDVHGIEISPIFHQEAVKAVERAVAQGFVVHSDPSGDADKSPVGSETTLSNSRLSLHLGPAGDFPDLLQSADLIFCYSTAFESSGFSEQSSAMILGREWNELLTTNCRSSSLTITTDKGLDPVFGWRILDRIDVPNPEVFESTGYIQRLERKSTFH